MAVSRPEAVLVAIVLLLLWIKARSTCFYALLLRVQRDKRNNVLKNAVLLLFSCSVVASLFLIFIKNMTYLRDIFIKIRLEIRLEKTSQYKAVYWA